MAMMTGVSSIFFFSLNMLNDEMFDDALALVDVHVVSYLQSYRPRIMGRYERLNFVASRSMNVIFFSASRKMILFGWGKSWAFPKI